jgi:hypothetical protein
MGLTNFYLLLWKVSSEAAVSFNTTLSNYPALSKTVVVMAYVCCKIAKSAFIPMEAK